MIWTTDPVWDAECYAAEQDKRQSDYPMCDCCGCRITEFPALHYKQKDIWLCGECVSENGEYYEEGDWA